MKIFEIWLQILILHKKVGTESTIHFLEFLWERGEKIDFNRRKQIKEQIYAFC